MSARDATRTARLLERTEIDPSSRLILEEAKRRGIACEILAPRAEWFRLRLGDRSIVCRESLSELTNAVALSRCDDKRTTTRLLREIAGLPDRADVSYIGLTLNKRGVLRALATREGGRRGVDEIGCVIVATDTFGQKNQGQTVAEGIAEASEMIRFAKENGLIAQAASRASA